MILIKNYRAKGWSSRLTHSILSADLFNFAAGDKRAGMGQDTVLIGGLGFLLAGGLVWLILRFVERQDWPARNKRLVQYALFGGLAVLAILIMRWHAAEYQASYATSWLIWPEQIRGPIARLLA